MAFGRMRRGVQAFLGAMTVVGGTSLALAVNAATAGDGKFPYVDFLREYAWWAVGGLTLIIGAAVLIERRLEQPTMVEGDPPPPPAPRVDDWLVQRAELRQAVAAVLAGGGGTVGLTTSLHGAGGFGKTRVARMVCADRRVRRHFRGRIYLVTIGRDVRSAAEIAAKVCEVTELITGERTTFTDPEMAGDALGSRLAKRPRTLLVLDDVWEREQLHPFLHGAPRCVRLVTTRLPELLDGGAGDRLVLVDRMTGREARQVLLQDLDSARLPADVLTELLAGTGHWPLLLRLVNRLIVTKTRVGVPVAEAARAAARRLNEVGPVAADLAGMDVATPARRERAVEATIEAAVDLLPPGGRERYRELGIFAEDEAVPRTLVGRLWQATAGLSNDQSDDLVSYLAALSLITTDQADGGWISLHDVHRDYLRMALGADGLARTNSRFIDAIADGLPLAAPLDVGAPTPGHAWWVTDDGYVLDQVVEHLVAAGFNTRAQAVATDLRWVERRLRQRGPNAPIADLFQLRTADAEERARDLTRVAHLLQRTQPEHAVTDILHSRLHDLPRWNNQVTARSGQAIHTRLTNIWKLPDQPQPALQRTISAGSIMVASVAVSPDGTWLAIPGTDGTVGIWDHATGTRTTTLGEPTWETAKVAVSPDGTWLAIAAGDGTVGIWDRATGVRTATLNGRSNALRPGRASVLAISPDGTWLAATSQAGRCGSGTVSPAPASSPWATPVG